LGFAASAGSIHFSSTPFFTVSEKEEKDNEIEVVSI
jgi:hypothetical protein